MPFIIQTQKGKGKYLIKSKNNLWKLKWYSDGAYKFNSLEEAEKIKQEAWKVVGVNAEVKVV